MIRKYLTRNGKIRFYADTVDGVKVTRMGVPDEYWMDGLTFLEWSLLGILDRCSGTYGFRTTINCGG